jgi:hypothetical protein
MQIKTGSRWSTVDGQIFVVDRTESRDGKDWVFYHLASQDPAEETRQFSCYQEAFVARFWEYTNGD